MLSQAWTTTTPIRPTIPSEWPWIREGNVTSVGTRRPTRKRRGEGDCGGRSQHLRAADSEKQLPSPADGEREREAALAPSARRIRSSARQGGARAREF
jgi:hypothetical protein